MADAPALLCLTSTKQRRTSKKIVSRRMVIKVSPLRPRSSRCLEVKESGQ